MTIAMLLVVRDEADVIDAHLAYHLNVGVDLVLVSERESSEACREILEDYARTGHVRRVPAAGGDSDPKRRTAMARVAIDDLAAEWLIDSETDEFWLPRGESLQEVLAPIPARYGSVQGLARVFAPTRDESEPFFERMTLRSEVDGTGDELLGRLEWALRPVYRARRDVVLGVERDRALDGRVPLRAWYPVEVLRFPFRSREQAEQRVGGRSGPADARSQTEQGVFAAQREGRLSEHWDELVAGAGATSQVSDERLRDALRQLRTGSPGFARPTGGERVLRLEPPTVVDDVAYAAECAAVREVDFEPLLERIAELEQRIGSLEARFWPRARRAVARVLRL